ncbi:hypothetical protein APHAL10511_003797 [Amanita phalloides]|nr:hypothetical protein APHAL10511_003797 [Amanita phalloides]
MQTYWPPEFYGQPTHGYTPFYSQQGFMPSQFPSFPPRPMMSAMPGGLGVGTSNKWPKLNTLLAAGETLVRYDVRRRPHETILANTYHYYGPQPALITSTPVTSMRLYSKAFPWAIDIVSEKRPVTCRDVWDAAPLPVKKLGLLHLHDLMVCLSGFLTYIILYSILIRIKVTIAYGLKKMVSFNCNVCSDVIKKPKLDQHYSRCKSSFDCIDCSKTFNSPAEWKDHTSCISEAEKYQKSLYKGPKTGGPSAGARGRVNGRGRGRDSIAPSRGGRQGNGRLAYAATGSNHTPLGSTPREFGQSPTNQDNGKVVDQALESIVVHEDTPIQRVEIDKKKEKRKAANDGKPANKKVKVEKQDDVIDAAATTAANEVKKRKKKDKVEEKGREEKIQDAAEKEQVKIVEKEEKVKEKEDKAATEVNGETMKVTKEKRTKKKEKREKREKREKAG